MIVSVVSLDLLQAGLVGVATRPADGALYFLIVPHNAEEVNTY